MKTSYLSSKIKSSWNCISKNDIVQFVDSNGTLRDGMVSTKWGGKDPRLCVLEYDVKNDKLNAHYIRDLSKVLVFCPKKAQFMPALAVKNEYF